MENNKTVYILFLLLIKSIKKKRTVLTNHLINAHVKLLRKLSNERRKTSRQLCVSQCSIPRKLFTILVPRFREIQKRCRSDNFWWSLQQPNNKQFYLDAFRMKESSFLLLCQKLEIYLEKRTLFVTPPVPVKKQVAICLYKLASCAEYRVVGDVFGVHKSTVHKYFHVVIKAINELRNEYIHFPQLEESLGIAREFERKSNIPNIIGSIDGTHIPILPPTEGYLDFINRKGWPSLVMQAVVDSKYLFRDISVKFPGSTHDATVFKESGLFKNSAQIIPRFSSMVDNVKTPLILIGDPAYPLLPWLMKPYIGSLSAEEESFNCHLSSARIVVENAFGRFKGRWRCLCKRIDVNPDFVPEVVLACTILHNFVEGQKETYLESWSDAVQNNREFPQPRDNFSTQIITEGNVDPKIVRNNLKNYLKKNFPLRQSHF